MITRRGKPVARIVAARSEETPLGLRDVAIEVAIEVAADLDEPLEDLWEDPS